MRYHPTPGRGIARAHAQSPASVGGNTNPLASHCTDPWTVHQMMWEIADDFARRKKGVDFVILFIGIAIGLLLFALIHDTFVHPSKCPSRPSSRTSRSSTSIDASSSDSDDDDYDNPDEKRWDDEESIEGILTSLGGDDSHSFVLGDRCLACPRVKSIPIPLPTFGASITDVRGEEILRVSSEDQYGLGLLVDLDEKD